MSEMQLVTKQFKLSTELMERLNKFKIAYGRDILERTGYRIHFTDMTRFLLMTALDVMEPKYDIKK